MDYNTLKKLFKHQFQLVVDYIDTLSDTKRLALRKRLENDGFTQFPKNLWFNYKTQKWIKE